MNKSKENSEEKAKKKNNDFGEEAKKIAKNISSEAKKAAKLIKEEAKSTFEDIDANTDDIKEDLKKGAEKVKGKAKEFAKDLDDNTQDFQQEAKSTANEFTQGAKDAYDDLTSSKGNKKILAGILAIIFGSLGAHKFILGYTKEGFIMLGATFVLSILSFGLLAWLVGLIGLIEGVIYLTKTDDEFYHTYQANQKPWF